MKTFYIPVPLEDRIFKNALYFGLFLIPLLLGYDVFISGDYFSIIIELIAIAFFFGNLVILKKRLSGSRQRYIFSAIIGVLMNAGWITGGGISILVSTMYFLAFAFILLIIDNKASRIVFMILIINYVVLFILEYFFQYNLLPEYEPNKGGLIKQFTISFIQLMIGGYFIVLLKNNYSAERSNLKEINLLLKEKTREISYQNAELKIAKDVLDQTVSALENQREELIDIKDNLEEKVGERTADLNKLNQQLLNKNQQLEQFTFIISHNLRAPIARIKGLIDVLPGKDFDPITNETLQRLDGCAENMERVFSDLSTILGAGKSLQQAREEVDFIQEIENIFDTLLPSIQDKNLEIAKPVHNSFVVKTIPSYANSILHNIIENAVKYSDSSKESPFIKIVLETIQDFYLVSISDNGIGIDLEIASNKIFRMYQRFNNSHPGQGFGLFLVKTQIEAIGGKIELESDLGKGTTFKLYFPKSIV